MLCVDILDEIFCVFPIGLVGVIRENLLPISPSGYRSFLTFTKSLHPCKPIIGLLMQVFVVCFIFTAHVSFP